MKPGALQYILQALLAARLVLGGVFVGLSKSEFNTVCVPVSSILIVAIITVILDAVIIVGLAGQAISAGVFGKMQDGGQASSRGKAVVAVLGGLVIWMGVGHYSGLCLWLFGRLTNMLFTDECSYVFGRPRQ